MYRVPRWERRFRLQMTLARGRRQPGTPGIGHWLKRIAALMARRKAA